MMVLSNGNVSLFDNKNKSNKSFETASAATSRGVDVVEENKMTESPTSTSKKTGPKVRKIKKIKKKSKPRESTNGTNTINEANGTNNENTTNSTNSTNRSRGQSLKFDIGDLNKGINLLDLSEEDLDRGVEIITRTKKYMNRDERNILIKLESVLDLVKGIKKLNEIDILSDQEESDFFRCMEEEDKKNMMIKEVLEVFPEKKRESVEKALDMKKKIDLLAELFLPETEDGSGFSLSSLADIGNLGSISNLKLLGSLLRGFDGDSSDEDDDDYGSDDGYETIEDEEDHAYQDVKYETVGDNYDEYVEVNKAVSNNKKYSKSKPRKNQNRRKTSSKK